MRRDFTFNPGENDLVVVSYTSAGLAGDLLSLPSDLESRAFALSRRRFDARDGFYDVKAQKIPWVEKTLGKYRRKPC